MAVKSGVGKKSLGGGKTRIGDFIRTRRRAEHPKRLLLRSLSCSGLFL